MVVNDSSVLNDLDLNGLIRNNGIILVVVGAVIFTLGFLGCFGAMRKSSLLLNLVSEKYRNSSNKTSYYNDNEE